MREGLPVAKPKILYGRFGEKVNLPQKNSSSVKFRRYEKFAPTSGSQTAATIRALVEGTVPSAVTPSITDVTITVGQYGMWEASSDVARWTNEVDVDTNITNRVVENMAETMDMVYGESLMSGTNVFRLTDDAGAVSGSAITDVDGALNYAALNKAIRNLKGYNAEYYKQMVSASTKIGTTAVRPSYIAIIHPDAEYDLENTTLNPGYKSISDYGGYGDFEEGEVGAYKNIRFCTSTLAKIYPSAGNSVSSSGLKTTDSSNVDVYKTLIFGKNAYACVDLAKSSEVLIKNGPDKTDPLDQYGTIGWKAAGSAGILNEYWILRIEHGCKA
jgi:N4-gp56 family major capsid protein